MDAAWWVFVWGAVGVSATQIQPAGNPRSSGYAKQEQEWYVEPRRAIDELLDAESFVGSVWDPACGGGNIPEACRARGMDAWGSDIADRGYGSIFFDFLTSSATADNIITNPPFGLAVSFVLHGLRLVRGKVAILQRTAWLEGEARYNHLFASGHLARVWQFRKRISMPPGDVVVKAQGGSRAFAWFVFDESHDGPPTLGWLP